MAAKRLTPAQMAETARLLKIHGTVKAAADASGLNYYTFRDRARLLKDAGAAEMLQSETAEEITFPDLPSDILPPREMIQQASKRFAAHLLARDARRWMEIKINSNKPCAVAFIGDPHIDNPGCNWPLLEQHIGLLESTPGLYAVNIGDLTDNWVGRLIKLYADQEMSKKAAWKLAKYFLHEAKISWLCHLLGNHDAWNDGPYLIKANARPLVPVEDWQSRFQLVFPNDRRVKIHAAHDFPGNSIWNIQHGPQKAAMLYEQADIYACGHKHQWHVSEGENSQRDFVYWLVRARGYKAIDSYASNLGYGSQRYGASITAVIDPTGSGPTYIRCFPDMSEAAEFLTWKRGRG